MWRVLAGLRSLPLIAGVLASFTASHVSASDGLQHFRMEARASIPSEPSPSKNEEDRDSRDESCDDDYRSSYCDDSDDGGDSQLGMAFVTGAVFLAASPFWLPAKWVGDDYWSAAFFPRYPYQMPIDGYLMIDPDLPRKPRVWSGRFQFERGGDIEDLTSWSGGLVMETSSRFGIDGRAHRFSQRLDSGSRDHLWLGDANLVFRFAQSPKLEMRTGIGVNWLADDLGSDYGFNFTYGGDWFPLRPLVVSSELDWGEIGHASLFHARITGGVQYHRAEIYAGYDYLDIGNAQLDTLIAGLRFWF